MRSRRNKHKRKTNSKLIPLKVAGSWTEVGPVEGWDRGGRDKKYMGWGQQAPLTPIKRRLVQHIAAAGPFESLVLAERFYPLSPNFTASHPLGFSLQ